MKHCNRLLYGLTLLGMMLIASQALAKQSCQTENIVPTAPSSRYDVQGNGVVVDKTTGLMWRTCVAGVNGDSCEEASAGEFSWAQALVYPETINSGDGLAGYTDWRLPNIRELGTLVELQCAHPAINADTFPNSPASHVWTSSPYIFYTHYSWYVDFTNGASTYDLRTAKKQLRLVRDLK